MSRRGIALNLLATALLTTLGAPRAAADDDFAPSAREIRPILVSEKVPDVEVTTVEGEAVSLAAEVGERPSVLVFYRGGW